jgi:hypothetical protein
MRLADTPRPPSKPDATLGQPDGPRVDGYSVTPAEGLDTSEIPKVPMHPEEVLSLLTARLALDRDDRAPVLDGAIPHETATLSATAWPSVGGDRGKVPSYPDITPSPIVIGLTDNDEALRSNIDAVAAAAESTQDWREPAAKDTPAEPIASVRVRQAILSDNSSYRSTANLDGEESNTALAGVSDKGSVSARLYFPPMRPPESWQGERAHEPLVQIVPDCDAKTRTARSLRRPSGRPAPPVVEGYGRRWALLTTGAALAIVFTVVILVAPTIRPPNRGLAGSGVSDNSALQLLSSKPDSAPSSAMSPASRLDSGTVSLATDKEHSVPKPPVPPSASAGSNISHRSGPPKVPPAQKDQNLSRSGKQGLPPSPNNDGLVF